MDEEMLDERELDSILNSLIDADRLLPDEELMSTINSNIIEEEPELESVGPALMR